MTTAADQLVSLPLRRSTHAAVRRAVESADLSAFQKQLSRRHRNARRRLDKATVRPVESILWSADILPPDSGDEDLLARLAGKTGRRRKAGIFAAEAVVAGDGGPLTILLAGLHLLEHGPQLSADFYVRLCCALCRLDPVALSERLADGREDSLPVRVLCEGELPWLLSLLLKELRTVSRRRTAREVLKQAVDASTDTDGFLHAAWADSAHSWLAPLVRAACWGDLFESDWLSASASARFADAARHCAALLTPFGLVTRPPRELRQPDRVPAQIVSCALTAAGLHRRSPFVSLAERCSPGCATQKKSGKTKSRSRRIDVCNQSDWAEAAVLRTGLQVDADVAVVTWQADEPTIHLAPLGTPLLSGTWTSEVRVADQGSTGPITDWACSCWFVDQEAAFVELETDADLPGTGHSVHLVRQVMLSLQDRSAVLCESVTCSSDEADLELISGLPLAADPLAVTSSVTRDLMLHADCISARAVPAWLDDDRIVNTPGDCRKQDDRLVLTGQGRGGATLPLILDWHPERQAHDADWNRLTVTEARTVMAPSTAAGFRVRIGRHQLLIYRSLRPARVPRAVLGQHTQSETIFGRVKKSGDVAPLVLVDADPT